MNRMARRIATMILLAALATALWSGDAAAAPTISLAARARPIPEVPHTGNIAGAGTSLEVTLNVQGTEYGGFPPPLTRLVLNLPPGMHWDERGSPRCAYSPLEPGGGGRQPCVERAKEHRQSSAQMIAPFGQTLVPETVSVSSFYDAHGILNFVLFGHAPVSVEMVATGVFSHRRSRSAQSLEVDFPAVETVPGAQLASLTSVTLLVGSSHPGVHGPAFSLRMPRACPQRSLRFTAEATFGGGTTQSASAAYTAACPRSVTGPAKPARASP
jgi:hypothetical protein